MKSDGPFRSRAVLAFLHCWHSIVVHLFQKFVHSWSDCEIDVWILARVWYFRHASLLYVIGQSCCSRFCNRAYLLACASCKQSWDCVFSFLHQLSWNHHRQMTLRPRGRVGVRGKERKIHSIPCTSSFSSLVLCTVLLWGILPTMPCIMCYIARNKMHTLS